MIQRDIEYSGQFSKDVKVAQKRHKDMNKLKYLMTLLINNTLPLPAVYKDHPLQGSWKGYRDAHWICPYISRHLLSLNPLLACCRRYSRGER
ncbi:mRNA interferase YafQ [Escherichia coli]|uniref:type II toxin-antitoxin system mRNA interferase toxin, RelE/StbE family n=1 Tax=Escherichia coli TaxID=562 RepID=UPI000928EC89|nr:mRNA interferase YafQ [Escherichia coli]